MFMNDEFARFISNELFLQQILDYRCGEGSLSYLFNPLNYIGVDYDADIVSRARKLNPAHHFRVVAIGDRFRFYDVAIAYDVFGCRPELLLEDEVSVFSQPRVIVSEVLSRYQIEDYGRVFNANGYRMNRIVTHGTDDDQEIVSMEFLRK